MKFSEKEMKEILSQHIQISDTVNSRLDDTYKMLRSEQRQNGRIPRRRKSSYIAAAIAVAACLAVPGAVYAASNLDFFEAMFGNSTKKSTPVIETEVDTGKTNEDGTPKTSPFTIPSHEFVSVDPKQAQELTGGGCMSEPVEKQLGDHTLCVENMVYDQNGAVAVFTLERPGGVTMLLGNADTNVRKGAYFSEDRNYDFSFGTTSDIFAGCNIYVDTEKSTPDKMYCTAYLLWAEILPEGVFPQLSITKYPGSVKDISIKEDGMTDEEWLQKTDEFYAQAETEEITLTDKPRIPVQTIDQGQNGCITYSPISIGVDMSKGLGLSEEDAYDLINSSMLEIKYKDGTSYIVMDAGNHIENNGYVLGGVSETWTMTAFNRIVDINEIQEIVVNGATFPAE